MSFRAPLRITGVRLRPPAPLSDQVLATPSAEQAPASVEAPEADSYIERLIKLIPVEVVGAYLVGRELAEIHQMEATWGFVCLVFVVVFRALMTQPEGLTHFSFAQVQTGVVLISLISFIIWFTPWGRDTISAAVLCQRKRLRSRLVVDGLIGLVALDPLGPLSVSGRPGARARH